MARRICRLADAGHKDVDLRQFEAEILKTVEAVVPGKNPMVEKDHFSTDDLTLSEKVTLGRALSKLPDLAQYGKVVSVFRLFEGYMDYSDEIKDEDKEQAEGGKMR